MNKNKLLKIGVISLSFLFSSASFSDTYILKVPGEYQFSVWNESDPEVGEWSAISDFYDCSSYAPSPDLSLLSDFLQSRTCSVDKERTVTEMSYNSTYNIYKETDSYTESYTDYDTESRTVSVELSDWETDTSVATCSDWSPDSSETRQGVELDQERACTYLEEQEVSYTAESSTIETLTNSRTSDEASEYQTTTGTRDYNWVYCAKEGSKCNFEDDSTEDRYVRYGANDTYNIKWKSSGVGCNNNNFGDPINKVVKYCWYDAN